MMNRLFFFLALILMLFTAIGCGSASQKEGTTQSEDSKGDKENEVQAKAKQFLDAYQEEYAALEGKQTLAYWTAANSGAKQDWERFAAADLALKKLHSDPKRYKTLIEIRALEQALPKLTARSLAVAELAFKGNQLPDALLEQMVTLSTDIEQLFNTFRAELDGNTLSNNDMLEGLKKSTDSKKRKKMWQGLKQVGSAVGEKLLNLAELRNQAAEKLGYANYWDMQVRIQEHDPKALLAIFKELEKLTDEPFREMKATLDAELARKFNIRVDAIKPWHYDNPFFQDAPPSEKIDMDEFYRDKPKESIIEITRKFFTDIGLPCDTAIAGSDLYERKGKDQHAFCITIDRKQDVRTLLNIKPSARWMETALHEEGHAVYYLGIDDSLTFNLREAAHIFTTEAVAMLFGALGKNPTWMVAYAGADPEQVKAATQAILEQRRREQLIFARWAMVMLHFERALYTDPKQDLNTLWWDLVERYQSIPRPKDRNAPDWAAKPHFTIAPVYYHNYLLGEVFAAQLRHTLAKMAGHKGSTSTLSFNGRTDFGKFLKEKIFAPGMSMPWPEFVKNATFEPLTARYFGEEVK